MNCWLGHLNTSIISAHVRRKPLSRFVEHVVSIGTGRQPTFRPYFSVESAAQSSQDCNVAGALLLGAWCLHTQTTVRQGAVAGANPSPLRFVDPPILSTTIDLGPGRRTIWWSYVSLGWGGKGLSPIHAVDWLGVGWGFKGASRKRQSHPYNEFDSHEMKCVLHNFFWRHANFMALPIPRLYPPRCFTTSDSFCVLFSNSHHISW